VLPRAAVEQVLAHPREEPLRARVDLVPVRLGDLRHAVEQGGRARPEGGCVAGGVVSAEGLAGELDLRVDLGLHLRLGELGPLVVAPGRLDGEGELPLVDLRGALGDGGVDLLERAAAVDPEGAREGLDGGEQPLLEGDGHQRRSRLGRARGAGEEGLAHGAVLVEQAREFELGRRVGQAVDVDLDDLADGELARRLAQVALEAAHHHGVELLGRLDLFAANEALRVEDLHQRREGVGVPVVRRRREEELVVEARRDLAQHAGHLGVDGVLRTARGCGVVGLVEDEQRGPGALVGEPVAQGAGVLLVAQEGVRDDEARVRRPGVHAVAALAALGEHVVPVEDHEGQPEAGIELVAPLEHHRGRRRDDDAPHLLAHEELAEDEPRLDGFAEPDIVRDEEVHARQGQGLAQGFELVGVDADARAEGALEEARRGGGHAVPALGVEVGGEARGRVEAALRDVAPRGDFEDARVELALPEHREGSALGVVVEAREADERGVAGARGRGDVVDQVLARADPHDLSRLRRVDQLSPGHRRAIHDRNRAGCVKRDQRAASAHPAPGVTATMQEISHYPDYAEFCRCPTPRPTDDLRTPCHAQGGYRSSPC
jgi:hypothetical protein